MLALDRQVLEQAQQWLAQGETIWLTTVIATFGSSPREPGSMMVAKADGAHCGSLSGGCVEENFLDQLKAGAFTQAFEKLRYGGTDPDENTVPGVSLPCGGLLEVLIEKLTPGDDNNRLMQHLVGALQGQTCLVREICLAKQQANLEEDSGLGPRVEEQGDNLLVRVGPAARLIIAGASPVSAYCAEFARALDYEVIICDPSPEALQAMPQHGVSLRAELPSITIARAQMSHAATAIVALTHDPRIDDLAMMEAVNTDAFYIGVMGSKITSQNRAARLMRSGGLNEAQVARIHMPIGLALGSKTPAEIALAVMADIVRCRRHKKRDAL
ncbi:XdhC family protein [Gilvimarinus sp. DA14]|uniref:XdhC family protein n=1 Tax=Gilvimarinus sp. DA14 TaxID=2956798 RepID=UPI0020B81073|nr:XdhC family protein [Gilvimarinus sp. DA14]UTF60626.1 XdhC family protein [Gilvimarinus sp. DA14]